jgi:hypothetical protein
MRAGCMRVAAACAHRPPLHCPGLEALAEQERAAKLEQARAEVAWDAEAAAWLLQKLRGLFAAQLAAEHFMLPPLLGGGPGGGAGVATVTVPQVPPEVQVRAGTSNGGCVCPDRPAGCPLAFGRWVASSRWGCRPTGWPLPSAAPTPQAELDAAAVEAQAVAAGAAADCCSLRGRRCSRPALQDRQQQTRVCAPGKAPTAGGGGPLESGGSRAKLRRAAKREREAQWAALNAARPDAASFEAPEDVRAMAEAAAAIGDLKLRGAPDFIPSEVGQAGVERVCVGTLLQRAKGLLSASRGLPWFGRP